jgi:hypothetical protein
MTPVQAAREVVRTRTAMEVNGVLLDYQTAGAICAVANALSPESLAKLEAMPIERAGVIAWKLVRR